MINLLPPSYSQVIHYGRLNTTLRRWLIVSLTTTGGMILIMAIAYLFVASQTDSLNRSADAVGQQLKDQKLDQVQARADEITKKVKLINQVLGQEIRFSDLIQEIGKVIPSGTVLSSLSLSKVSGAIDLSTSTKDYASAAQVAANLSDPKNNIFSSVDIVSVTCSTANSAYPCAASYKALFAKNTPSRFVNLDTKANP